jgi:putative phosphoribosyl transferase
MTTDMHSVRIAADGQVLEGDLMVPENARGLVLFAHGSGSSRFSSRNRFVASMLVRSGIGSLLLDLLTREEEALDAFDRSLKFDIGMLTDRVVASLDWVMTNNDLGQHPLGIFGASTGAAAALIAAARKPDLVKAVVSRGGRPDLAGDLIRHVHAPTMLIVGGEDKSVMALNESAYRELPNALPKRFEVVAGASHLFEEEGALEHVAEHATRWFEKHLGNPVEGAADREAEDEGDRAQEKDVPREDQKGQKDPGGR